MYQRILKSCITMADWFVIHLAFFNGPSTSVLSDPIAVALQEYITSFAINGKPSGPSLPSFPIYTDAAEVQNLNATSITQIMDPFANQRCDWWQQELYV